MEYPYFPFYVKDFIIGTIGMTTEEVGGYMKLLLYQWDKGSVPADEEELLSISGLKIKNLKRVLKKFNKCGEESLKNKRLEIVRGEVEATYTKNRANGAKGGRPPKNHGKPTGNPNKTHGFNVGNPRETQNEPMGGEIENQIENKTATNVAEAPPPEFQLPPPLHDTVDPLAVDRVSMQLKTYMPELTKEEADLEAKTILFKVARPGPSYIATWVKNLREKRAERQANPETDLEARFLKLAK